MDNAGENKKLAKMLEEEELKVKIEFTPVDDPRYNRVLERSFATLYGRVRAMLNGAGFLEKLER